MTAYPITYTYAPTHVRATVPALPTIGAVAPTYELARVRIAEAIGLHLEADAAAFAAVGSYALEYYPLTPEDSP